MVLFYPSKNNDRLNGKDFIPETITGRIMVNPKMRAYKVLPGTKVICDSGAFQDIDTSHRLTPRQALERQITLEDRIASYLGDNDWYFEAVCIYDQMAGVDEVIENGKKIKKRGTVETGELAVKETLRAADYYNRNRSAIHSNIIFIGQGINPDQYISKCITQMLDLMRCEDWFGFGGFCIIGKTPSLKPLFMETFSRAIPILKKVGIRRLHLLGVTVPDMVRFAGLESQKEGMILSIDSSSVEVNSVMGRTFTDGKWSKTYVKEQKFVDYHPNDLAMDNIRRYKCWSDQIGE